MRKKRLDNIEKNAQRLTGMPCEEMYISDFDKTDVGRYVIDQYTDIYELNLLAYVMEDKPLEVNQVELALGVLDTMPYVQHSDPLSLMNYIYQADELPYYSYECGSYLDKDSPFTSKEECFGYDLIKGNERLSSVLDAEDVLDYFNYEDWGRAQSRGTGITLGDYGYLDNGNWPDPGYWTLEEIYNDYPEAAPEDSSMDEGVDNSFDAVIGQAVADHEQVEHPSPTQSVLDQVQEQ